MSLPEALSVAETMHLPGDLFWPTPVLNLVPEEVVKEALRHSAASLGRIALLDPNVDGNPVLAIQTVTSLDEIGDDAMHRLVEKTFRTTDPAHPGVQAMTSSGRTAIAGPIEVLSYSYFRTEFPDTFRTAPEIRELIAGMGWDRVVAFQTRNPMHLAHEELCRMAKETVKADGILVHMLLGKLKPGDIPAAVRDACIRKMVECYFPPNTVLVTGYGFDMMYAGPREAVLHAVFRQNAGASELIVGRDHAGVGSYYGPFEAQEIFDEIPAGSLEIEIFRADHTAWSNKLGKVVMMRDHPDHEPKDYLNISGTRLREMLGNGQIPPAEFIRPEVARILMDYYKSQP
jgi:sulfate adenylyltransferase